MVRRSLLDAQRGVEAGCRILICGDANKNVSAETSVSASDQLKPITSISSALIFQTGLPSSYRFRSARGGQTPVAIIGERLFDFLARIHHERAVLHDWLAQR